MSDLRYQVAIDFTSNAEGLNAPGAKLGALTGKLDALHTKSHDFGRAFADAGMSAIGKVDGALSSIGSSLLGVFETAATVGGGLLAAGLAKGIHEGIAFSDYKEQLQIGLASVQTMLGGANFGDAEERAKGSVERLRTLAQALPGELKDVANAFSYIQPVGITHGVDSHRLEDLAARSVAAAAAVGVPQNVAGHEIAAMLEGRARSAMPMVGKLGLTAKEFNGLSFDKRLETLEGLFGKLDPAIDRYSQSWAGLTSSLRDNVKQLASVAATPLFGRMKDSMSASLDYLSSHGNMLETMAERFGGRLVQAYDMGLSALHHWGPILVNFAREAGDRLESAFERVYPLVQQIGGYLDRALSDPHGTIDKLIHGAELFGALKVGTSAMSGMAGLAKIGGPLIESLSGLGAGAAGVSTFGVALLAVAPLVIGLGVAAEGLTELLTDSNNLLHDAAVESMQTIGRDLAEFSATFGEFWESTKQLREGLGFVFVKWLEASIRGLTFFYENMLGFWTKVAQLLHIPGLDLGGPETKKPFGKAGQEIGHLGGYASEAESAMDRAPRIINHSVNIHNPKVEIKVTSNQDPSRIAKEVSKHVKDSLTNPTGRTANANADFLRR